MPAISLQQPNVIFRPFADFFRKDPRHYQIAYLSIFLVYGIFFLGWDVQLWQYVATFAACILTQIFFVSRTTKRYSSVKSAMISALSLCLLFKAASLWVVLLAAVLSIASKFLIRIKGKHVFNPANFGIIATILLTGGGWISPGQWGNSVILLFVLGAMGSILLLKVGRLDTSLAFIGTFAFLEFCRSVLYLGWGMDFYLHQLTSGTLLLFTFFMITDPVTTPNSSKARILWAALIGLVSFLVSNWLYVHTAPIWALFFIAPLTAILDRLFIHPKFKWS